MSASKITTCSPMDLSDEDVLQAMKAMHGYIDITPGDFKEVYRVAFNFAVKRLAGALRAQNIMTQPVHLIQSDMPLGEAAKFLADYGISGAPVVERSGKILGVVSENDFLGIMGAGSTHSFMEVISNCLEDKGCLAKPLRRRTAGDIMTSPAITGTPETSISRISAIFDEKHINRLPIVTDDGRPIGIVTRADMVTGYCALM